MNKLPIEYVAGLVDADGSFNISMQTPSINLFNARFVVNYRSINPDICNRVCETMGVGKVYYSHRVNDSVRNGRPGIWSWQTVKLQDTLVASKLLLPHLHIKNDVCATFIDALSDWIMYSPALQGKRIKGSLCRPRWVMEKALDTMLTLNKCTQTKTYWDARAHKIAMLRDRIEVAYNGNQADSRIHSDYL